MSQKIASDPWDARRSMFWNKNGGYERFKNGAELDRRKFGTDRYPSWKRYSDMSYREARDRGLIPEYEEGKKYSKKVLEWMANEIIFNDPSWDASDGLILAPWMYKERLRREVYTGVGTPDPSIKQGLYWRTHPQGRPWKTKEQRKGTREGFYR